MIRPGYFDIELSNTECRCPETKKPVTFAPSHGFNFSYQLSSEIHVKIHSPIWIVPKRRDDSFISQRLSPVKGKETRKLSARARLILPLRRDSEIAGKIE